jgi:hypothetical protein
MCDLFLNRLNIAIGPVTSGYTTFVFEFLDILYAADTKYNLFDAIYIICPDTNYAKYINHKVTIGSNLDCISADTTKKILVVVDDYRHHVDTEFIKRPNLTFIAHALTEPRQTKANYIFMTADCTVKYFARKCNNLVGSSIQKLALDNLHKFYTDKYRRPFMILLDNRMALLCYTSKYDVSLLA